MCMDISAFLGHLTHCARPCALTHIGTRSFLGNFGPLVRPNDLTVCLNCSKTSPNCFFYVLCWNKCKRSSLLLNIPKYVFKHIFGLKGGFGRYVLREAFKKKWGIIPHFLTVAFSRKNWPLFTCFEGEMTQILSRFGKPDWLKSHENT